jgi:6-phosphogluconolactonase
VSDNFDDFDELEEMEDDLDLTLYADSVELTNEVIVSTLLTIDEGLTLNGEFHLALTGGTLGLEISEALVIEFNKEPSKFEGLHIWWSDERFVESTSVERNAMPLHGTLMNKNIEVHEVLASDQVQSAGAALTDYRSALESAQLDLVILGVGPDGHVASLFPGLADLDNLDSVILIENSPKPPSVRISFTMAMINSAEQVWIVAAGEGKAEAVTKIVEGDLSVPASYVRGVRHTRLIVDTEAFFAE